MLPDLETLALDLADDGVLTVAFDRPDHLNALTLQSMEDLGTLWEWLIEVGDRLDGPDIGAVVLTGHGRAFCAGGDVKGMSSERFDITKISLSALSTRTWRTFARVPQPVVGAVNGDAVGAGLFLAALCDVVVAADSARFGDPHVKVGLVASGGGMLSGTIGLHNTKAIMLSGDLFSAADMERMGLVQEVVAVDEVVARAHERAVRLARLPKEAVRWTKRSLNRILDEAWNIGWDAELALEALSAQTDGHREAVARFAARS